MRTGKVIDAGVSFTEAGVWGGVVGELDGLCLVIMARVSPFYIFIGTFSSTS